MARAKTPEDRGLPKLTGRRMVALAKRGPTARIVPPVKALLNDILSLAKTEAASIRKRQEDGVPVADAIDKLASAVARTARADAEVEDRMRGDLAGLTDDELEALESDLEE